MKRQLGKIAAPLLVLVLTAGASGRAQAQTLTFTVLHNFGGGTDGTGPSGLVMDAAGNLYGTTFQGGSLNAGTVFKLDTSGKETVLYSFMGGSDGAHPQFTVLQGGDGPIMDAAGNLYGTTSGGGGSGNCVSGCGTVFKLDPSANETVLHSFQGTTAEGYLPSPGLARDAAGNLYGVTFGGGTFGSGTVFKLDPSAKATVLYSFTGGSDGHTPSQRLVVDGSGNLYGTTEVGGTTNSKCNAGCGVVFKLDATGHETVLYSFTGASDGAFPFAGLIMDAAGNLYGTTRGGGVSNSNCTGCGTVFKLDPSGNETVLYRFAGGNDGQFPQAGLIMDASGILYGTTEFGGTPNSNCPGGCGTVFKLDPSGNETVLHRFSGGSDGQFPQAGLIMDAAGNFYGTTLGPLSGPSSGTVFKLSPGVAVAVLTVNSTNPNSGVAITVQPADNNGNGNGSTSFTRTYNGGTAVTLTAPLTASGNRLSSWTGCDSTSGTTCTVTMNANRTVSAKYVGPRKRLVQETSE